MNVCMTFDKLCEDVLTLNKLGLRPSSLYTAPLQPPSIPWLFSHYPNYQPHRHHFSSTCGLARSPPFNNIVHFHNNQIWTFISNKVSLNNFLANHAEVCPSKLPHDACWSVSYVFEEKLFTHKLNI